MWIVRSNQPIEEELREFVTKNNVRYALLVYMIHDNNYKYCALIAFDVRRAKKYVTEVFNNVEIIGLQRGLRQIVSYMRNTCRIVLEYGHVKTKKVPCGSPMMKEPVVIYIQGKRGFTRSAAWKNEVRKTGLVVYEPLWYNRTWIGFQGIGEVAVIDDYDEVEIPRPQLLRLLSGESVNVQGKEMMNPYKYVFLVASKPFVLTVTHCNTVAARGLLRLGQRMINISV